MEQWFREIIRAELAALEERLRGPKPAEEFITPAEAAEILKRKPKTIRALVAAKKLKRYGTSERILLSRAEVQALAANPPPSRRKTAPKTPTPESEAERLTGEDT